MVLRGMKSSSGIITIQNIRESLMGVNTYGWDAHYDIQFLWVDEWLEDRYDWEYRIGFNYKGTEYSTYLHRNPAANGLYSMGCFGPNMKEYRFAFVKEDFRLPSIFVSALHRKLNEWGC